MLEVGPTMEELLLLIEFLLLVDFGVVGVGKFLCANIN